MRLVTFEYGGRTRIGALRGEDEVVPFDAGLPTSMVDLVAAGDAALDRAAAQLGSGAGVPLTEVRLLPPIRPRNNIMCIGKNYLEHAAEFAGSGFDASQQQAVPDHPVVFTKALSSVVASGDPVHVSADSTGTSDYEGELAVVIGQGGRGIAAEDAYAHVFGYTIVNDMTVRRLQRQHVQFFLGKSAATYCPMGPALVTRDEIVDVTKLWVRTTVNGEQRQAAPVADLIFDIPTLIATISVSVLLEPGDVIATGTPAGVGIGFTPPRYLRAGDVVEVSVDGLGTLTNPLV
ncbi:fumarylacetoacetate hydrolase family protein [Plantactinospora mayteni]|uniref:Hydrolase n=1 Tax=Plantactinospora mayteni TaxID=566021 RepID=A0ABQ4F1D4_9ACTN|nr:fumarylacetoacetate hydrolase family protein [Plantactinospora mayteni]GIH00729.1 hydrolase [Plantactinospora mayteni]